MKIIRHLLLLTVVALTAACASRGAAVGGTGSGSFDDHDYVATRAFNLRRTPSVNGSPVRRFRAGDGFSGRMSPVDDVWTYLELFGGAEGYLFGQPYRRAEEAR